MLLLSDPSLASIPVRDCGEDLVDVHDVPELLVDPRKADAEGAWARLRTGLVDRLVAAQGELPPGVRLLIIEGYRPARLQQRYFDEHCADLAKAMPEWSRERVLVEASKHVSPPAVAPHPCGAAVDLTLVRDGEEADLGTPVNATPAASAGACFTAADNIADHARQGRDTLGFALSRAGLVNYPPEWWHWSYGDRYWAALTGASHAQYGPL